MPNWVTNKITTDNVCLYKLSEIAEIGIARYYRPMPEKLIGTIAPAKLSKNNTIEKIKSLENEFGSSNWFEWAEKNWGTKWGCCDGEIIKNSYVYQTAWSPLSIELIHELSVDLPSFHYIWEEEQGFGQEWKCENGELSKIRQWDE